MASRSRHSLVFGLIFASGLAGQVLPDPVDGLNLPGEVLGEMRDALVQVDLDADGWDDLVGLASQGVVLYYQQPSGGFAPADSLPLSEYARDLVVDDVDGDGLLDVVVANGSTASVTVLLGLGGRAFGPEIVSVVGTLFGGLSQVESADLDHDGDVDLIVQCSIGLLVAPGANDGTFVAGELVEISRPFLLGDLDGDRHEDLAVLGSGGILIRSGAGDGSFGAPTYVALGPGSMSAAQLADLDGNGLRELVVLRTRPASVEAAVIHVFHRGVHAAPTDYALEGFNAELQEAALLVDDADGDGRLDIIASERSALGVSVLYNRGAGVLEPARAWSPAFGAQGLAVEDVNVDGRPDLLVVRHGRLAWLEADARRTLIHPLVSLADAEPVSLGVADLNTDGLPDLCTVSDAGIAVLVNRGRGTLLGADPVPLSTGVFRVGDAALCHADKDGTLDIVLVGAPFGEAHRFVVMQGQGDGSFHPAGEYLHPVAVDDKASLLAADVNADGQVDLLATRGNGNVSLMVSVADGSYVPAPTLVVGGARALAAGDVNVDGVVDLIALRDVPQPFGVYLGAGDGTFTSLGDGHFVGSIDAPELMDVDGDGHLDLFVQGSLFRGRGDGSFDAGTSLGTGVSILADLTQDGIADLVSTAGELVVWPGAGGGQFGEPLGFLGPGGGPSFVADMDGDGTPDLVRSFVDPAAEVHGVSIHLNRAGP